MDGDRVYLRTHRSRSNPSLPSLEFSVGDLGDWCSNTLCKEAEQIPLPGGLLGGRPARQWRPSRRERERQLHWREVDELDQRPLQPGDRLWWGEGGGGVMTGPPSVNIQLRCAKSCSYISVE